jgi:hypothetical protein
MILRVSEDSSLVQYKLLVFGSGDGVLCEVVQMNYVLQMFKLGECLFSCFKQEKYLTRRAEDFSYSHHKCNIRAKIHSFMYLTGDQHWSDILFCCLPL